MPPDLTERAQRLIQQEGRIVSAIEGIQNGRFRSIAAAALFFDVPHTTLSSRMNGRPNMYAKLQGRTPLVQPRGRPRKYADHAARLAVRRERYHAQRARRTQRTRHQTSLEPTPSGASSQPEQNTLQHTCLLSVKAEPSDDTPLISTTFDTFTAQQSAGGDETESDIAESTTTDDSRPASPIDPSLRHDIPASPPRLRPRRSVPGVAPQVQQLARGLADHIPQDVTSSPLKRYQACRPCYERHRKCDGDEPCFTCTERDVDCYYTNRTRRERLPESQSTQQPPLQAASGSSTVASDHCGLIRRMEANSGAAFGRKSGLKIDPAKAPKLNLFGWNIGARQRSSPLDTGPALSICEITSWARFKDLALVYFEKVNPYYGFLEQSVFFERSNTRWKSSVKADVYDSVLCGVAAIGSLFSQQNATITELHLVRTVRSCLEMRHLTGPPCLDLLAGWTLRSMYLRMTDSPHSTWMATSTLMHLIEASGLHSQKQHDFVLPPPGECDQYAGADMQRLVGVAHHLNMWTSYDLGLSRVSFPTDDLSLSPSPKPGDYTGEILGLLPVSVRMDPEKERDEMDLESTLSTLLDGKHTQPPSVMAHCNLVLRLLRRIHTQNLHMSTKLAEKVLPLLKKALGYARSMVMDCSPWHEVANVPFQIICVLLVMDTRSSLAMLPEAMQTLNLVASTYDTETMKEACSAAYLLVLLYQQRRRDDVAILGEALNNHQQEQPMGSSQELNLSAEEHSWLGALVADLPGLQRVDLDRFLNPDMIDGSSTGGAGETFSTEDRRGLWITL